ncbi:hypothetical protein QEN19_004292 [Hanseniaspora menglaensis]
MEETLIPVCERCKEQPAVAKTRKEYFCKECFSKFILLKQRRTLISDKDKFLETVMKVTYKTPNDEKILLALSFGKSSLVVLQNLIEYLNNQYSQQQKTGFILETITVVENDDEYKKFKEIIKTLEKLKDFEILNKGSIKFRVVNINQLLNQEKLSLLKLNIEDYKLLVEDINEAASIININQLLIDSFGTQYKTLSSKEDFKNIAIKNTIEAVFHSFNYKALVYGSSMSKLATEIVTNTVIGRGDVIAKNLDTKFYPLTDVFYSEVDAYYQLVINNNDILLKGEEFSSSNSILIQNDNHFEILKKSKQTKTISDITMDYFNTIEGDYANVISTVVKTGLKLGNPNAFISASENLKHCKICSSNISKKQNPADWINKITVMKPAPINTDEERANYDHWKTETALAVDKGSEATNEECDNLCYGCTVTLNTSSHKSIKWNTSNKDAALLNQVLEDFVL